jgi:hypothetical protein
MSLSLRIRELVEVKTQCKRVRTYKLTRDLNLENSIPNNTYCISTHMWYIQVCYTCTDHTFQVHTVII